MSKPIKILWLGSYAHGEYFENLISNKIYEQTAANRVQYYYIQEIIRYGKSDLSVISSLVTVPYPKSSVLYINERKDNIDGNVELVNTPFLNLPYVNLLSQNLSITSAVKKWSAAYKEYKVWVIVYSMRLPLLCAARTVKNIIPDAVVVNIVPDLPQFMHHNVSFFKRVLSKHYQRLLYREQKCLDGYVLYTKSMADFLPTRNKEHIVIEGLFDTSNYQERLPKQDLDGTQKVFLYAGILQEEYGVKNLVQGFIQANLKNTELHLYGNGSYLSELKGICKKHSSVVYKGMVAPHIAYEAMCNADLVINPRPSAPEFTKFSFPSKVFEYMSSGTPVLMTRLPGIPVEYYDYVYSIVDETIMGISDALIKVAYTPESKRQAMAQKARRFIFENKSSKIQVDRLISFIRSLENEHRLTQKNNT